MRSNPHVGGLVFSEDEIIIFPAKHVISFVCGYYCAMPQTLNY